MSQVLKAEELGVFRRALADLQSRLRGDVEQMTEEALNGAGSEASGNLSNMPIHMADLGTDNYDQEFTLGLIENEQATLEEVREALERLDAGSYGLCLMCGTSIAKNRLQAIPHARHCIDCARKLEKG